MPFNLQDRLLHEHTQTAISACMLHYYPLNIEIISMFTTLSSWTPSNSSKPLLSEHCCRAMLMVTVSPGWIDYVGWSFLRTIIFIMVLKFYTFIK